VLHATDLSTASRPAWDSIAVDGRALGANVDGYLQVEGADGLIHTVASGEVRLLQ
jgi:hypothetical protein